MEYRKFPQGYVLRLDPGEEIVGSLTRLVEAEDIHLASVSALGAANDVTIGIFNTVEKQYYSHRYQGNYEISALVGNVTGRTGTPTSIFTSPSETLLPERSTQAISPPPPSAPLWRFSSRSGTGRWGGSLAMPWGSICWNFKPKHHTVRRRFVWQHPL